LSRKEGKRLKRLFLHNLHNRLGAHFVEYGGWELPLYYESIITEHTYVRVSSAIFDLSYLGRIEVSGEGAESFLERHTTRSISRKMLGRGFYTLMLNEGGTIFADGMVYKLSGRIILSTNPLVTEKVYKRLKDDAPSGVSVRDVSEELLCLSIQGRRAQFHLQRLTDMELVRLKSGSSCEAYVVGAYEAVIGRVGYTGEDGFEILIHPSGGEQFYSAVLEVGTSEYLIPAGIGARNSLRIEAGFLLYDAEIDDNTFPTEAGLERFIDTDHDFIGKEAYLKRKEEPKTRCLVTLNVEGRRIPREGAQLFAGNELVGAVTRGTYSPVLSRPIALAYIKPEFSLPGTEINVEIRGKRAKATVVRKPLYIKKLAGR